MNNRKKKLQGSVLFTVVFVMSILIVLLLGTLTLAYSTNSRAHVNYSSAQTGITSRLITESTLKAIDNNEDYAKVIAGIDKTHPGPVKVKVSLSSDKTALGTMGHGSDSHDIYAEIAYAGEKEYYDPDKKTWQNRSLLRFTSTVSQGGVDKSCTAYVLKHYKPDSEGGSSGGAGFVTTGGAELPCQTSLFGGTYVNLPQWDDSITDELGFYENLSKNVESRKLKGGNGFVNVNKSSSENLAKTSFYLNNDGAVIEAETVVYGNLGINNWGGFVLPDKGKGITVWGDFVITSNAKDHTVFYEGEKLKAAKASSMKFNEIPFMYVNGKITTVGDSSLRLRPEFNNKSSLDQSDMKTSFPLNIFCGSIDTSSNSVQEVLIGGDLYCMDNAKSIIGTTQDKGSRLYNWTYSVINKVSQEDGDHVFGGIACKGELELRNMTVNGDVRVEGDCTIIGNCTINGNLVVGGGVYGEGKLKMGENSKIYCDFVQSGIIDGEAAGDTKRVASKRHYDSIPEGKTGADAIVVVENEEIACFPFVVTEDYMVPNNGYPYAQGVQGAFGEQIYNTNKGDKLYYEWKNDAQPNEIMRKFNNEEIGVDEVVQNLNTTFYREPKSYRALKVIDQSSVQIENGSITYSEIQTGEPTDEEKHCFNLSKMEEYSWLSRVDKDGNDTGDYTEKEYHTYNIHTGAEVTTFTGSTSTYIAPKANFNQPVYPKYAERAVVLGLEVPTGVSKEDSQVVRTIKEIKEEVADPYQYADYNSIPQIKNLYSTAAATVYESVSDVETAFGKTYMDQSLSAPNLAFTTTKTAGKTYDEYICINSSCTLKNIGFPNDKNIVINPGDSNLLIIVENVSFASGHKLYIDDSGTGTVFFYIADNSYLSHLGTSDAIFVTLNYANVLMSNDTLEVTPEANDGAEPPTYHEVYANYNLMRLGAPRAFVFGGSGSQFLLPDFKFATVNVISPNTFIEAKASATLPFSKVYYDGYNTDSLTASSPVIFGCINAGSANMENDFRCIYVPDGSGNGGQYGQGDPEFWYRVLYYTEY